MPEGEVTKAVEQIETIQEEKNQFYMDAFKEKHGKIINKLNNSISINEQQNDIKDLTSKNIEIMKTIFKQQQQIKRLDEKVFNEFNEYRTYNHELELGNLEDLNMKVNRSKEKMHKLTSDLFKAMYEGVLIPGELSIRHHRICPFRCQYTISDQDFFNMLRKDTNQDAILKTLVGSEQQKILKQLFEVIKLLDSNKEIVDDSNNRAEFELTIPLEEPMLFIDRAGDVNFELITDINIKNYRISFTGYNLMDYFNEKSEEEILEVISDKKFLEKMKAVEQEEHSRKEGKSNITLTERNYRYFISNFGEYIIKTSRELEKLFAFKVDFLDKAVIQIQNIGSKYLIADQMMQQSIMER